MVEITPKRASFGLLIAAGAVVATSWLWPNGNSGAAGPADRELGERAHADVTDHFKEYFATLSDIAPERQEEHRRKNAYRGFGPIPLDREELRGFPLGIGKAYETSRGNFFVQRGAYRWLISEDGMPMAPGAHGFDKIGDIISTYIRGEPYATVASPVLNVNDERLTGEMKRYLESNFTVNDSGDIAKPEGWDEWLENRE